MEVFITRANEDRMLEKFSNINVNINQTIKELFDFKWINSLEKKRLLIAKMFYEDPSGFFEAYTSVTEYNDNNRLIKKNNNKPAYHVKQECEQLVSDYENYKIPDFIYIQGEEARDEFRKWFHEHEHLIKGKRDLFEQSFRLCYKSKDYPTLVKYENSGSTGVENGSIESHELHIKRIIHDAYKFCQINEQHQLLIDMFGKESYAYAEWKDTETSEILKKFELEFKRPLIAAIKHYYRAKNNHKLTFRDHILEQLNFRKCSKCSRNLSINTFNELYLSENSNK